MRTFRTTAMVGGGVLAVILLAGFFHSENEVEKTATRKREFHSVDPSLEAAGGYAKPGPVTKSMAADEENMEMVKAFDGKSRSLGFVVPRGLYHRQADMKIEVEDTIEHYEKVEKRLEDLRGEIVEINIRGNDSGRQGLIRIEIPAENFNTFVSECRGMGRVELEQITAKRLPKNRTRRQIEEKKEGPDPREIALVSLTLRDQKVAPQVEESRGILTASFSKSAGHFLKGMAVMVELIGYVLPFALALVVILVPGVLAVRFRRRRQEVAEPIHNLS